MVVLARKARESGRDYALRVIKENIINLGLAPGTMVSESELAELLGLSRTPVREALMELSKRKVMEILPQKGSRVALIDYAMVEETNFTRLVLETAVIALVCEMAQPCALEALEQNVRLQEFYLQNPDPEQSLLLDNAFHAILFHTVHKQHTYEMMHAFTIHFDRVRRMDLNTVKDSKIAGDHRAMLEAIHARDAESAQALMQKHLTRYRIDKERIVRDHPAYFANI